MRDDLMLPETIDTIPEALAFWAERTPHAPALRAIDGRVVTHSALSTAVRRVATKLADRGVTQADQVAIIAPASITSWIALLGTMVGAVSVPLSPSASPAELTRDLERLAPRLIVVDTAEAPARTVPDTAAATISLYDLVSLEHVEATDSVDLPKVDPDSVATILHTSGTTGLPKRVPRQHGTFVAAACAERDSTGLTPNDVLFLATGPHTKAGQANLLGALLSGGSCVVASSFDPTQVLPWLAQHQPTWMFATATQLNLLLDASTTPEQSQRSGSATGLRVIRTGSQPMTPGTAARAERLLGAAVLDGYGMSEVSCIAASGPTAADRRDGSCGRPWAVSVRILDDFGREAPIGALGEVVVRGKTLFRGYLDDEAANAAVFLPGGWFRTGDIGFLDSDGYLHLMSRRSEIINRGGEKIAPREVDDVLSRHPAVSEAAGFAVPDAQFGEDIVVAVVLRPGMSASPRELRRWALDRLSAYKVPRRIWFRDQLPRTMTGKIQRRKLAEQYLQANSSGSLD